MDPSPATSARPNVRCREIVPDDCAAVAGLLTTGFAKYQRSRAFWDGVLGLLGRRQAVAGLPQFGYVLDADGEAVGVLLMISTEVPGSASHSVRCNVSSWYVDPRYRAYAAMLVSSAFRHKNVTFVNITAAPHTWPILSAQGYRRFGQGTFVAAPLLSRRGETDARLVTAAEARNADLDLPLRDLIEAHHEYGCHAFWCVSKGRAHPFVYRRRSIRHVVPCAQLIYCDDQARIPQFARLIGRHMIRHGLFFMIMDANGAVPGLTGRYFDGVLPRFYRGPDEPRLGDLAYTETAMFGV